MGVVGERGIGGGGVEEVVRYSRWCQELSEGLGLDELAGRVRVFWNGRMRSCAGRAFWPQGVIQLNPRLLEISEEEVERTILHELAHLVSYERNPRRRIQAHGVEWKLACCDLGIPGERATHQLELPVRRMAKRWKYSCPECGVSFEKVRRFRGAVACYECCQNLNDGGYDRRYRLVEEDLRK